MARKLTEEEVEKLEKQRELQSRAQAATDPNALYNQRMQRAHEAAMERQRGYIMRNPNAETNTTLRHQVLREQELRAAREHELGMQKNELETREKESYDKRMGMKEQGSDAAKSHSDATIRAAELQAASAEKIAGINKDRDLGVAEWGYKGKKDEGDAKVEAAGLQADATVKATEV